MAGFSPDQYQAFQQIRDQQGFAQPYYNQAAGYFNQSAQPITGAQIGNYLNPYANYVLGNLKESQGSQMKDLTGRLIQQAGGTGADRIAVGQAELARQQNLATGQTLANIYQPALSAAQQDAQRQAQAGYAFGNLGGQAQNSALQGTAALYNMGSQQQQLDQAGLNAIYNQALARSQYPFQQAQFLSGITGQLAPVFGGTTTGQGTSTVTKPPPNPWSQILGIAGGIGGTILGGPMGGSIGSALGSGLGGFGGGKGSGTGMGGGSNPWMPGTQAYQQLMGSKHGGRVERADGGRVSPFAEVLQFALQNRDAGGRIRNRRVPLSDPNEFNEIDAMAGLTPNQQIDARFPMAGDIRAGANVMGNPMMARSQMRNAFLPRAFGGEVGSVDPTYGGGISSPALEVQSRFPAAPDYFAPYTRPSPASIIDSRFPESSLPQAPDSVADRVRQAFQLPPGATVANVRGVGVPPQNPYQVASAGSVVPPPEDTTSVTRSPGPPTSLAPPNPDGEDDALPNNSAPTEGEGLPYPDLSQKDDVSRQMAKSPWTALARAGFAMAAGESPFFGVNFGKGALEGLKELDEQRKALREEEGVNHRARQLALEVKKHQDQYSKMTPFQKEQIRVWDDKTLAAQEIARMKADAAEQKRLQKAAEDEKKLEEKAAAPFTKAQLAIDQKRMITIDAEADAAKKAIGALGEIERLGNEAYIGPIAGRAANLIGLNSAMNTQVGELNLANSQFMKGNFSNKDLQFIQSISPNATMPKDQFDLAITLKRAAAERINMKNQFYREWLDKRKKLSGADKAWDRYINDNEMTVEDKASPGGRKFNPNFNRDYSAYMRPRKGEVIGGYRYKGGPEGDESSWEKAR